MVKAWGKNLSPEASNILFDSLPVSPRKLLLIIILIVLGVPIIKYYLLPKNQLVDILLNAFFFIFLFYLIFATLQNYKEKTGRDLNQDYINKQNEFYKKKAK
jgi:hypothetical protein